MSHKILALVPLDRPSPVGFMNVFDEDDIWIKIRGCEDCPSKKICCGTCPMLNDKGCFLHLDKSQSKPFRCIINPNPRNNLSWCQQEFQCVQGEMLGQIRKIKEPLNAEQAKKIS